MSGTNKATPKTINERIALLSDSTCDTAESYVRAILAQFNRSDSELLRFPKIRTVDGATRAIQKLEKPFLVAYTFASAKLRKHAWHETKKRGLYGIDLLYPTVELFADFLQTSPSQREGAFHTTDSVKYYERMEAIDFTVKHDDGMKLKDIIDSDLILTGVSRTSKTPTSMYMAHKGFRVANVPLVQGIEPPPELIQAHEKKVPIILLTIAAPHLERIRRSRFKRLGTRATDGDTYVNMTQIEDEINASKKLARRYKWPVIDVTNKAIEETVTEILLLTTFKER